MRNHYFAAVTFCHEKISLTKVQKKKGIVHVQTNVNNINENKLIVSLPPEWAIYKNITLPVSMKKEDVRSYIFLNREKIINEKNEHSDNFAFDFYCTPMQEKTKQNAHIYFLEKNKLERVLENNGIEKKSVIRVELDYQALWRLGDYVFQKNCVSGAAYATQSKCMFLIKDKNHAYVARCFPLINEDKGAEIKDGVLVVINEFYRSFPDKKIDHIDFFEDDFSGGTIELSLAHLGREISVIKHAKIKVMNRLMCANLIGLGVLLA